MKKNNFISNYILKNKKIYIILIILFTLGIIIGVIRINFANDEKIQNLSAYVNNLVENLKNSSDTDYSKLFVAIKQNTKNIGTIGLLGYTIIGSYLIYIFIIYYGFKLRLHDIIFYKSVKN